MTNEKDEINGTHDGMLVQEYSKMGKFVVDIICGI